MDVQTHEIRDEAKKAAPSARLLLIHLLVVAGTMGMSTSLTGCLFPVGEIDHTATPNYPPEVDLDSLDPRDPHIRIRRRECTAYRIRVNRVYDFDDQRLLFRFVANNGVAGRRTRWIPDEIVSELTPGSPHRAFVTLIQDHFPDQWTSAGTGPDTAVLSLFVTDAPAWEIPEPDNSRDDAQDLGRIPPPDDEAARTYDVIEVRWAITFDETGECRAL